MSERFPITEADKAGRQPIETAPRDGTLIYVMHDNHGKFFMEWSSRRKRWEGKRFGIMRMIPTFWDTAIEQPTHWLPGPVMERAKPKGVAA